MLISNEEALKLVKEAESMVPGEILKLPQRQGRQAEPLRHLIAG
jgi:hypothetical protein